MRILLSQLKNLKQLLLPEVVEKTQDFLKGVGYCFEELHTQVFPIPEDTSDKDEYASIYRNID